MKYHTVIFDFDGTLADGAELFWDAINAVAPEFGFAPVTREELPRLKEKSARELLAGRAGIPLWNIPKIRRLERRTREEFRKRAGGLEMFGGIQKMMRGLREAGCELGIVTSNEPDIVAYVLAHSDVEVDFVHAGSRFFGKARAIREALRAYDIDRSRAVYVGDELRDVEACKKVGIDMIAVGWGLNSADALRKAGVRVAATPQELLSILGRQ